MSRTRSTAFSLSALLVAGALCAVPAPADDGEKKPAEPPKLEGIPVEGFQQLLPRGGIPALVDPDFVSVAEAEIPDGAWVLGFERDGEAFAYDLNLLNSYEVVNHGTESGAFAAVW